MTGLWWRRRERCCKKGTGSYGGVGCMGIEGVDLMMIS